MMKKAILMMTFGSPEEISFEGVAEFFTNIRRGVRPQDHEIQTLYDNYVLIGGTPLQRISLEEVEKVRQRLSGEYAVYFANKFSRPFIPDVIKQMEEDGIEECICLILEPHFSYYSVMGYEKFIQSDSIRFNIIKEWYQEEAILLCYSAITLQVPNRKILNDSYSYLAQTWEHSEIFLTTENVCRKIILI